MWLIVTILWLPWAGLALWMGRQLGLGRSLNADASADELARRAYAKGDITRERFLELMADLGAGASAGSLH
jgi:uncharacterized membrane protein